MKKKPVKKPAKKKPVYNKDGSLRKKVGRPRVKIDWSTVEKLCQIHCTCEEIAGFIGHDVDTLVSNIKKKYNVNFSDYFKQKSAPGNVSLRRRQFKTADDGNATMQIWLGKQWLGQRDQPEQDDTNTKTALDKLLDAQDKKIL